MRSAAVSGKLPWVLCGVMILVLAAVGVVVSEVLIGKAPSGASATHTPTAHPTSTPTFTPSTGTDAPTHAPTTGSPTAEPTVAPSVAPTAVTPTAAPTIAPTATPSIAPTAPPSDGLGSSTKGTTTEVGAIAGGVVGFVVVALVGVAIFVFARRRKGRKARRAASDDGMETGDPDAQEAEDEVEEDETVHLHEPRRGTARSARPSARGTGRKGEVSSRKTQEQAAIDAQVEEEKQYTGRSSARTKGRKSRPQSARSKPEIPPYPRQTKGNDSSTGSDEDEVGVVVQGPALRAAEEVYADDTARSARTIPMYANSYDPVTIFLRLKELYPTMNDTDIRNIMATAYCIPTSARSRTSISENEGAQRRPVPIDALPQVPVDKQTQEAVEFLSTADALRPA